MDRDLPNNMLEKVRAARRVVVLSGAGMSAESGVPTFRDAQTGLWARYDAASLATPEAWNDDPSLVWTWYQWRAELVRTAAPNAGHFALAQWSQRTDVRIVTQNVDDLHERAGSSVVTHLHGSLFAPRCSTCDRAAETSPAKVTSERSDPPQCAFCAGLVRPGVVWFGEALPTEPWNHALEALADCDLLLVVGTSGVVYPAAGLPSIARAAGTPVIEINPESTALTDQVDFSWRVNAAVGLPSLLSA